MDEEMSPKAFGLVEPSRAALDPPRVVVGLWRPFPAAMSPVVVVARRPKQKIRVHPGF